MQYYTLHNEQLYPIENLKEQCEGATSYRDPYFLIDTGLGETTEGHNGYLCWDGRHMLLVSDDYNIRHTAKLPYLRNYHGEPETSWTNPVTDRDCTNINTVYKAIAENYDLSKAYVTMMTSVAQKVREQLFAAKQVGLFFARSMRPERSEATQAKAVLELCLGLRRAAIKAEATIIRGPSFSVRGPEEKSNYYRADLPIQESEVCDYIKQGKSVKWHEDLVFWQHPDIQLDDWEDYNSMSRLSQRVKQAVKYNPEVGHEYDLHGNKKKDADGNYIKVYGSEFDRLLEVYEQNQQEPRWA